MNYLLKYGLDEDDINTLLLENDRDYILSFTEDMIKRNIDIFRKYNIDFANELIMFDIGVFAFLPEVLDKILDKMVKEFGTNYLEVISNDMGILIDYIYNEGNK